MLPSSRFKPQVNDFVLVLRPDDIDVEPAPPERQLAMNEFDEFPQRRAALTLFQFMRQSERRQGIDRVRRKDCSFRRVALIEKDVVIGKGTLRFAVQTLLKQPPRDFDPIEVRLAQSLIERPLPNQRTRAAADIDNSPPVGQNP